MQARNLPDDDALAVLLDELLAAALGEAVELPLDPHAAASRATTLNPAASLTVPLTVTSSAGGGPRPPCGRRLGEVAPAGWGSICPGSPPGMPEGYSWYCHPGSRKPSTG